MTKGEHEDAHDAVVEHGSHEQHAKTDPFTHEERVLIEVARRELSKFEAHHHHHHHHKHQEYVRPEKLTTPLGLFALHKLNVMNPDILKEKEKRLLKPSAPGVITSVIHAFINLAMPLYVYSVWRNHGWAGFRQVRAVLPLAALVGINYGFQQTSSVIRELWMSGARRKMVNQYKDLNGQSYLLDVLHPGFRLPAAPENQ